MPVMGDRRAGESTVFELSRPGRRASSLPPLDVAAADPSRALPGVELATDPPRLPELGELDLVRHFTRLSQRNHGIDVGFYPLGSCSMKYNPKVSEAAVALPGFRGLHPWAPAASAQGTLELLWELERWLVELTGLAAASFQPAAGAHGELTGLLLIRAYHEHHGGPRRTIIVPDSAHGTNPASAALNGYEVVSVGSGDDGILHPDAVAAAMDEGVAALMITNPNTLGLFERHIAELCEIVHAKGGLVYGDGANLNALLGIARPGDMGIDVMHMNLHKTFSTPHGGGGPGAGPVAVKALLASHLPVPVVARRPDGSFAWQDDLPGTIGRLHGSHGNVGMLVRAYAYILSLGAEGLRRCSEMAVLNANYLLARLAPTFHVPYPGPVMHECVLSDRNLAGAGVTTMDLAKRLIDHGYHPPTIYFPLIVPGALMIEPTESESLEGLDRFADTLLEIAAEAERDPDVVRSAPHRTRLRRLDETLAARKPVLRWQPDGGGR
jgi:glycine dehydrogenase subunit 2